MLTGEGQAGFNEAAIIRPRKLVYEANPFGDVVRFNEAAIIRPRKPTNNHAAKINGGQASMRPRS